MKRKILAFGLVTAMAASLVACGGGSSSSSTSSKSASAASSSKAESSSSTSETSEASSTSEKSSTADKSASSDEWVIDVDDMMSGTQFEGLKANDSYSFQIVVKAFQNTYWQAVIAGVNAAAEDLGVTVDSQGPNTESDIADQINMLNTAINNGPAGIGLSASDASSVVDSLNSAKSAGIPIVAFDTTIDTAPEGTLAATIATDSIAAGDTAAAEAWDALADRIKSSDKPVRFGMVAQDATSSNHQQRGLGFVDGIISRAKEAGYKVAVIGNDYFTGACSDKGDESSADVIIECAVPSQSTLDYSATEASAIMNKADTICMYATGQTASEALVQADSTLGVLGTDPSKDMIAIGFDSGTINKEKINDGTLYGCITQMPYAMGYYTVCALVQLANGGEVEDMNIPGYFYNADNMTDDLIAPNLYD